MSARAIASAKQKRVGSISNATPSINNSNNSSNPTLDDPNASNRPVSIPQAIVLLDQRLVALENSVKGSTIPNQTEIMAGFAQHFNTLDAINEESKESFRKLEKENAVLIHKNNELQGKLGILESSVQDLKKQLSNMRELQDQIANTSTSIASVDVATQLSNVSEAINAEEIETIERPKLVRSTNMDKNIDRDADNVSEGAGLGAHLQ